MTEYICTSDGVCIDQTCGQVKGDPQSGRSIWGDLRQLLEDFGGYIVEVFRANHDPLPKFSNGGTRVVIRPDRIDLV